MLMKLKLMIKEIKDRKDIPLSQMSSTNYQY